MRAFFYYAGHALKNQIRKLAKTYVIIILVAVLIGALIGGLAATFDSDDDFAEDWEDEWEEEAEEDDWIYEETVTIDAAALTRDIFSLAAGGVILVVLTMFVLTAEKSGSGIFQMGDVNLLFPSPMRPQSVLLFRLIFKMAGFLAAGLYLLFQFPNWTLNAGLSLGACFALFAVYVLMLITGQLLSVLVYTVTATHVGLRKFVRPVVIGVWAAAALGFVAYWKASGEDPFTAAVAFFNSKVAVCIPIWGWIKGVADFALAGNVFASVGMGIVCVAMLLGLLWIIRSVPADFYEDAMAKSEETAAALAAAKEKRSGVAVVRKKERSERVRRNGAMGGSGGTAIFCKNLYNRFRFAKLYVFSGTMVTYLLSALATVLVLRWIGTDGGMYWVIAVLAVITYFRALGSPLSTELSTSLFFTLPVGVYQKFFWTLLSGSAICFLDLLPAVVVSAVLIGPSAALPAALGLLLILGMDFFSANAGAFADLSLPSSVTQGVKTIIQVLLVYLGMIPAAIIFIVGIALGTVAPAIIAVALAEIALGFVLFGITPSLVRNGRS